MSREKRGELGVMTRFLFLDEEEIRGPRYILLRHTFTS
jgi:hypothetical protein